MIFIFEILLNALLVSHPIPITFFVINHFWKILDEGD